MGVSVRWSETSGFPVTVYTRYISKHQYNRTYVYFSPHPPLPNSHRSTSTHREVTEPCLRSLSLTCQSTTASIILLFTAPLEGASDSDELAAVPQSLPCCLWVASSERTFSSTEDTPFLGVHGMLMRTLCPSPRYRLDPTFYPGKIDFERWGGGQ